MIEKFLRLGLGCIVLGVGDVLAGILNAADVAVLSRGEWQDVYPAPIDADARVLADDDRQVVDRARRVARDRRVHLGVVEAVVDVLLADALRGVRDNETRMVALGYPVYRLKLAGFVAAGAVAGLAGGLLASHNAFVSPSIMHWTQSALLLVMVMLGGAGRRWGAPLGVALWLTLEEVLKLYTDYWHWPLGLLLLLVVFLAPQGVAALLERRAGQEGAR